MAVHSEIPIGIMVNLLDETYHILHINDRGASDVRWVGSEKYGFTTWDAFEYIADREYYNGFGLVEIEPSLQIIGDDFWLERGVYDGSEWWEFKELPKKIKICYSLPWVFLE